MSTRTIRVTLEFTIEPASQSCIGSTPNGEPLGQLVEHWWWGQKQMTNFAGIAHCSGVEIIGIEEPKAARHSAAFQRALAKKRAKVQAILD